MPKPFLVDMHCKTCANDSDDHPNCHGCDQIDFSVAPTRWVQKVELPTALSEKAIKDIISEIDSKKENITQSDRDILIARAIKKATKTILSVKHAEEVTKLEKRIETILERRNQSEAYYRSYMRR